MTEVLVTYDLRETDDHDAFKKSMAKRGFHDQLNGQQLPNTTLVG